MAIYQKTTRLCRAPSCDRIVGKIGAKGLCNTHYLRWKIGTDLARPIYPLGPKKRVLCKRGHALTEDNIIFSWKKRKDGTRRKDRQCKICRYASNRRSAKRRLTPVMDVKWQ